MPGPATHTLRILSCNILAGASIQRYRQYVTRSWASVLPSRAKLDNLDSLARTLPDFDIVGLQETDAGSLRSGFRNQTRYLAETAGMPFWSHQPNRKMARLAYSANGMISRIEPHQVLDYPLPGRGRGALMARFGTTENALVVVIAHLSLGPQARERQLQFIAELLAGCRHVILMGDLNSEPDSPEMRLLFRRTHLLPPAQAMATFPSWRPRRAIDHILLSSGLRMRRQWTLPHAFSDHLPLAAEVELPQSLLADSQTQRVDPDA